MPSVLAADDDRPLYYAFKSVKFRPDVNKMATVLGLTPDTAYKSVSGANRTMSTKTPKQF